MAIQDVDRILEGLRIHQQRIAAQNEQASRDRQIAAQTEAEQGRIEQGKQDLAERKRQFDITNKAAQAMHDLQIMQKTQELTGNALQGIPIPGEQVGPAGIQTQPGQLPLIPGQSNLQLHTLPISDSNGQPFQVQLPTPQDFAKQQADLTRITNAPKEEAATREKQAQQQTDFVNKQQLAEQAAKDKILDIQTNRKLQMDLEDVRQRGENARNAATNAMRLKLEGMKAKGDSLAADPSTPLILDDITNGKVTEEQIKKDYPKTAASLFSAARATGSLPITNKESDKLKDLDVVATAVPLIQELNDIRNKSGTNAWIPGTAANKAYNAVHDSLLEKIPAISRIISEVKRFNKQEMDQYINALVPGRTPGLTTAKDNAKKFQEFVGTDIQRAFDTNFSRLPPQQQKLIKNSIGFDRLPVLGKALDGQAKSKIPVAGDVEDGHIFLGGDPSKPENWKKQ